MRAAIAAVVGALIVFFWGFAAWGVFDLWGDQFKPLPEEVFVATTLVERVPESGTYYFPARPSMEASEAEMTAWENRHRAGPLGILHFTREGREPVMVSEMLRGLGVILAGAVIVAAVMSLVARLGAGAGGRAGIGLAMVCFAVVVTRGADWTWFSYPSDFSLAIAVDMFISWALAIMAMAAIVPSRRPVPSSR